MPMLRARTIVEAHLYLDLLRADGELGSDDPGDPDGWTTLTEGPLAWTLHADGAGGRFEPFDVTIAYRDLADARSTGLRSGSRTSTLIDAGQWLQIGRVYAEQAVQAAVESATDPDDATLREDALEAWRFALDVLGESLRFLPEDGGELPDSAFWTDRGRVARNANPGRFTRAGLEQQLRRYEALYEDFAGEPAHAERA